MSAASLAAAGSAAVTMATSSVSRHHIVITVRAISPHNAAATINRYRPVLTLIMPMTHKPYNSDVNWLFIFCY